MLLWHARTRIASFAAAAGLALMVSLPAASQELYHWRGEDGAYSYTDDLRRVPERYRGEVEVRQAERLNDYPRYTPEDDGRMSEYARELDERVDRLREFNEFPEESVERRSRSRRAVRRVDLRLSRDKQPVIEVSTDGNAAPVVIEEVRVLPEGASRTRTDTVIRQGDRILAIVKPSTVQGSVQYQDESELED
jgi:hypothetical protein